MISPWAVAGVFFPAGILAGFAAGAIGFTAWSVVVPLALSAFKLSIADTLFLSVSTDVIGALALTVRYGYFQNLIHWKIGALVGVFATVFAIPAVVISRLVLPKHEKLLRAGVPYATYLFSLLFVVKALFMIRKKRRAAAEAAVAEPFMEGSRLLPVINGDKADGAGKDAVARPTRSVLVAGALSVSSQGVVSGFLGVSGGLNLSATIHLCTGIDLIASTGTGMLATLLCMSVIGSVWAPLVNYRVIWQVMLALLGGAPLGVLGASQMALKLSPIALTFFIAAVLLVIAVLTTVQHFVLERDG